MALLYRMGTGNGGSDIKPFIVEFTASDNDYNGQTVTMKYLGTPHAGEVVSDVSGTIVNKRLTLYPMHDGEWSITSEAVSGKPFSNKITLDKWDEYAVTLISGLNVAEWLNRGRWTGTQYTTLANILADEKCVRQLMTVHDSVDYLVTALSIDTDAAQTILDNDICAKWINLRDYALDMLYANQTVKAVMDKVDKYGYGEWALIDGTWQPKSAVPVMTSNTAPYGVASASSVQGANAAYKAFSGSSWASALGAGTNAWLQYKFVNPTKIKLIHLTGWIDPGYDRDGVFKLQASNDGSSFKDITTIFTLPTKNTKPEGIDVIISEANQNYYFYYRLVCVTYNDIYGGGYAALLDFKLYGRSLNVSDLDEAIPHPPISEPKMVLSGVTYWTDKTERDFEVESGVLTNRVKYIYDHGVEVVPLTKTSTSVLANIDKESKNLLRAKAGYHAKNSDKLQRGSGFSTFSSGTNPNNWYLDISSLGGTLSTGFSQVTDTSDIECWME